MFQRPEYGCYRAARPIVVDGRLDDTSWQGAPAMALCLADGGVRRGLWDWNSPGLRTAVAVDGANRHDCKMVQATLESLATERPEPTAEPAQGMCLDKGYDYPEGRALLAEWGYTAHIRARGEEAEDRRQVPGYRARRWVWNGPIPG